MKKLYKELIFDVEFIYDFPVKLCLDTSTTISRHRVKRCISLNQLNATLKELNNSIEKDSLENLTINIRGVSH